MMQSEKVAAGTQRRLRGRRRAVLAGAGACRGRCASSSAAAAQAPALVDPSVRALDAALVAIDEARAALEDAIRATEFDPRELEQTEERLFALRAAARKYDVPADELAALRERFAADVAAIDAGEEQLAALERALGDGRRRPMSRRPRLCRPGGARPPRRSTRRCRRSCRR